MSGICIVSSNASLHWLFSSALNELSAPLVIDLGTGMKHAGL